MKKNSFGFTLLELLIVVAIIGVLSSIVLTSLNAARDKGKLAFSKQQLKTVRIGIALLEDDTGKWPNGCPPDNSGGNPEVALNAPNAGLAAAPTVFSSPPCSWTAADIAKWRGPYVPIALDPWGTPYYFDPDYYTDGTLREDCPTANAHPGLITKTVILSAGPNKIGGVPAGTYDCDDIVLILDEGYFAQ